MYIIYRYTIHYTGTQWRSQEEGFGFSNPLSAWLLKKNYYYNAYKFIVLFKYILEQVYVKSSSFLIHL